jgi:hypothetical protein
MIKSRRFHGMRVVSATETLKSTYVLELTSNDEVVVRYYDENGDPEDDWIEINLILQKEHPTESDITSHIKKQAGTKALCIEECVVEIIQSLAGES